jgi:hypothetical protein
MCNLDEMMIALAANPPPTIGEADRMILVVALGQRPPANLTMVVPPTASNQLRMLWVVSLTDVKRSRASALNKRVPANPSLALPLMTATICDRLLNVRTFPGAAVNRDCGILGHAREVA